MNNILQQTQIDDAPVTDTCPKRQERVRRLAELVRSGNYNTPTKHIAAAVKAHIETVIEAETATIN